MSFWTESPTFELHHIGMVAVQSLGQTRPAKASQHQPRLTMSWRLLCPQGVDCCVQGGVSVREGSKRLALNRSHSTKQCPGNVFNLRLGSRAASDDTDVWNTMEMNGESGVRIL